MESQEKIKTLLELNGQEYCYSGYQLESAFGDRSLSLSGGKTSYWPGAIAVDAKTFFDLGSLTKVICTTSILARLFDKKQWELEARVSDFVSDLKSSQLGSLEIGDLLQHVSGLKNWHPLFQEIGRDSLLAYLQKKDSELQAVPAGTKAIYSDLGFWILGLVIEKAFGSLSSCFQKEVVGPLKLKGILFGKVTGSVAATEFNLFRNRLLQGEVFDDNSFALGGTSAHAGLFGSAAALVPWCKEWLAAWNGESDWLSQKTAQLFTRRAGKVSTSSWALGWDTRSATGSTSGTLMSEKTFGHLGYPGCSVWMDPEKKIYTLFLTNRVHPSRYDQRIRQLRPVLHDEVMRHWGKQ